MIQLAEVREKKKLRDSEGLREKRRIAREAKAAEWGRQLAAGEVSSRAELARREGVSRAWVTKVLGSTALS